MNYRIRKIMSLILIAVISLTIFSSCEEKGEDPQETSDVVTEIEEEIVTTCFLLGNTANMPEIDIDILEEEIKTLAGTNEKYCLIILDGEPEINDKKDVTFPKRFFNQKKNNEKVIQKHIEGIASTIADDPEIDILEGLDMASRALSGSKEKKRLIVFSSGLSTAGDLNFAKTPELISKRPTEVVDMLNATKSIPDLSGIDLVWYGLGDVAGEQEKLSNMNKFQLKSIWSEIITASKPASAVFDKTPPQKDSDEYGEEAAEYPEVSPVTLPTVLTIAETEIGFEANEAILKDRNKAIEIMAYYADCIKAAGHDFYVVGSTATYGTVEGCRLLGEQRADVVKDILCKDYSVSGDSLYTYSIGQMNLGGNYEWRLNDLDENGKFVEEIGAKNRKVMIIDAESEDGKRFLQQWENSQHKN